MLEPVCPSCKNNLVSGEDKYDCKICNRTYPIVFGIPDFRLDDPFFFTKEKEATAVSELTRDFHGKSYADLVEERFEKNIPEDLRAKYVNSWLRAVERNKSLLDTAERLCSEYNYNHDNSRDLLALDVGCGTGGMVVALSSKYGNVVGFDVSMESLIYAKKLLEENKCNNVKIFCSGINSLPFPDNSFDVVSASNVIEHIQDQRGAIEEIHRVQKTGGIFFGDIPNRYTLKPEPHVNIRFVGFLPRRLAHKYVMFRRNRSYEGYNLPSYYDIINLFEPTYGVDNLKVRSFYEITDAIKKFLNIRFKHTSAIRRIGSFFCHYFFVIARKG